MEKRQGSNPLRRRAPLWLSVKFTIYESEMGKIGEEKSGCI